MDDKRDSRTGWRTTGQDRELVEEELRRLSAPAPRPEDNWLFSVSSFDPYRTPPVGAAGGAAAVPGPGPFDPTGRNAEFAETYPLRKESLTYPSE